MNNCHSFGQCLDTILIDLHFNSRDSAILYQLKNMIGMSPISVMLALCDKEIERQFLGGINLDLQSIPMSMY